MHRYTVYNNVANNINSYLSVIPCVKDPCAFFIVSLLCYISFLILFPNISEYAALISIYIFTMI